MRAQCNRATSHSHPWHTYISAVCFAALVLTIDILQPMWFYLYWYNSPHLLEIICASGSSNCIHMDFSFPACMMNRIPLSWIFHAILRKNVYIQKCIDSFPNYRAVTILMPAEYVRAGSNQCNGYITLNHNVFHLVWGAEPYIWSIFLLQCIHSFMFVEDLLINFKENGFSPQAVLVLSSLGGG